MLMNSCCLLNYYTIINKLINIVYIVSLLYNETDTMRIFYQRSFILIFDNLCSHWPICKNKDFIIYNIFRILWSMVNILWSNCWFRLQFPEKFRKSNLNHTTSLFRRYLPSIHIKNFQYKRISLRS